MGVSWRRRVAVLPRVPALLACLAGFAFFLGPRASAGVEVTRGPDEVRLRNGVIEIAVSADGRFLQALQYAGQSFVRFPAPLYEMLLVGADGTTTVVDSKQARESSVDVVETPDGVVLTVTGKDCGGFAVEVRLEIRVDATPFCRWRANIANRSDMAVRSLTYPIVAAPRAIGSVPVAAEQENLAVNAGFEAGLEGWELASPRQGEGDQTVSVVLDASVARSGANSARLEFAFDENGQIYCPVQAVAVQPNTDYLLSAYLKTDLAAGDVRIEMQDVRGWKSLCQSSERVGGRRDWERLTVAFRTPVDTTAVRFGVRHVGSPGDARPLRGLAWLDDVTLARAVDLSPYWADDALVLPNGDGLLFPSPGATFGSANQTQVAHYPGASMQFMAYHDAGVGLYMAAHDPGGNVKRLQFTGGAEALRLSVEHLVPEKAGNDTTIGYDTVLGGFKGDWYTAADIYREWAWQQVWCKTKWMDRADVHDWLRKWPAMVKLDAKNYGEPPAEFYGRLATFTRDFRQRLGQDVITFFHGWGENQWQMGSARREQHEPWGGADVFRKGMADIAAAGGRPFVFVMADGYTLEARDGKPEPYNDREVFEKEAAPFGEMGYDGKNLLRQYSDVHFLAPMCPTTDYWKQCLAGKVAQLVSLGVPFVQLDSFPCTQAKPCYNPKHGHPLGYGSWWYEGYRDLLQACRDKGKALNPEYATATEEMCEFFIPQLDFYMNRVHGTPKTLYDSFQAEGIPAFTYVYHEYLPPYAGEGDATTLPGVAPVGKPQPAAAGTLDSRGIALSLIWGRLFSVRVRGPYETYQPEPALLDLFVRAHQAASTYAYDYVVRGRMLRPLPLQTSEIEIKYWRWWTRPGSNGTFRSPAVLSAAWQSPTGRKAALLVNISGENAPMELTLPSPDRTVTVTRNGKPENTTFAGPTASLNLAPLEIVMVEYE
ncbi:MAG: hypothetical protein A3K19_24400 [Lentisphaerae bacterium RIFOXYB12_FULL_65_16]|nr:MAG: hypothetical protein A3K18_05485 [Lentisphaerae bacterium RIFOXYA12_64_32]OGV90592.1 MAG: hypothetical protein A3K19_24400 [Lentisphaerae bacterium RIFOXYB12_FULL_65_16]